MSIYLALIVIHRELQNDHPPSIARFMPEPKHAILERDSELRVVRALL